MQTQIPEGTKVTYQHTRVRNADHSIAPRGGKTTAFIYENKTEGRILASASAECSQHDNYNKKIGRDIALGRALKLLENA